MITREHATEKISGNCPVCDGLVSADSDVEESEIICCVECCSMVVVDSIRSGRLVLEEAPQIEEDWGE
jgi:lysine biosynthesis protein LysW